MTLDELIAVLTEIRGDGGTNGYKGGFTVYVRCPEDARGDDCWLRPDNVRIAHGQNESTFIRIDGGTGA